MKRLNHSTEITRCCSTLLGFLFRLTGRYGALLSHAFLQFRQQAASFIRLCVVCQPAGALTLRDEVCSWRCCQRSPRSAVLGSQSSVQFCHGFQLLGAMLSSITLRVSSIRRSSQGGRIFTFKRNNLEMSIYP